MARCLEIKNGTAVNVIKIMGAISRLHILKNNDEVFTETCMLSQQSMQNKLMSFSQLENMSETNGVVTIVYVYTCYKRLWGNR